jgi:hypothetical protein
MLEKELVVGLLIRVIYQTYFAFGQSKQLLSAPFPKISAFSKPFD